MNPVNIGQSPDIGQKSAVSKKENSQNDSFSDVFAEAGGNEEISAEQSETLGDELTESPDSSVVQETVPEASLEDVNVSNLGGKIVDTEDATVSKLGSPGGDVPLNTDDSVEVQEEVSIESSESEGGVKVATELPTATYSEKDASGSQANQAKSIALHEASNPLGAQSTTNENGLFPASPNGREDVSAKTDALRDGDLNKPLADKTGAQGLVDKNSRVTLIGGAAVDELPHAYKVRLGIVPSEAEHKAVSAEGVSDAQTPSQIAGTDAALNARNPLSPFEMTLQSGLAKPGSRPTPEKNSRVEAPSMSVKSKLAGSGAAPQTTSTEFATSQVKTEMLSAESFDRSGKDSTFGDATTGGRGTESLGLSTSAPTSASQAALMTSIGLPQKNDTASSRLDVETRLGPETVGISQALAEATFKPLSVPGNEVVQRIAAQLSEAFASKGERKVDVMLNPKELGKVKMQLATSEGSVRVMIHVERPETGDLMRRHIGELEKEFREMGFENISFSFSSDDSQSQSSGSGGYQPQGSEVSTGMSEEDPEDVQTKQNLSLGGSGLDMRV